MTVVIGAGSGGLTVALGLARLGRKVTLIEGGPVGGDCTNTGCIPSKSLIHLARQGRPAGEALAEVRRKRAELSSRETELLHGTPNLNLVRGWARFVEPYVLEVQGNRIESREIVIATGSRPAWLEIPGLPPERTFTNENLFSMENAPEHLVIVGGGVIALEMAFAFRRLGSQVSLLVRSDRLLSRESARVSPAMAGALERSGIRVLFNTRPFLYADGLLKLRPEGELSGVDAVLLAVGRLPRLEGLDIDRAGLVPGPEGLAVDDWCRTDIKGIFAVGDVTAPSRFTHSANAQGRRVVQKLALGWLPLGPPAWVIPSAVFSEPEVASVRLARPASGYRTLCLELNELDRGYTDDLVEGFLELEVEPWTGRLQAATLVAPHASEMISLFTLVLAERVSLYRLQRLVYPYPTLSEATLRLADEFVRERAKRWFKV